MKTRLSHSGGLLERQSGQYHTLQTFTRPYGYFQQVL